LSITKAPVSVCLITRNEQANIEAALQSIRPYVAEIVIVDTGSTDDTPAIAQKYADKWERFTACNDAEDRIEDFSLARQRSFDLATQPWVMWMDGDDVMVGAEKLSEIVAAHDHLPRACVMWNYDYDHDGQGNITMRFIRERLVKPARDFKWISPVHETLVPQVGDTPKILIQEGIRNVHRRRDIAKTVESGRNLRILQTYHNKVGDTDVRALYYLGLELGWTGNPEQSIDMHKRYIALSGWEDEKYLAHLEVCRHYQGLQRFEEAAEWALKAIPVREAWGEAFFSLSKTYYFLAQKTGNVRDWERCVNFARRYLTSPETQTVLFINPMERKVEVHRYLIVACMNIGDPAGALASCEEILKTLPADPNTQFNLNVAKSRVFQGQARQLGQEMHKVGALSDQALQLFNAAVDGKFRAKTTAAGEGQPAQASSAATIIHHPGLDIILYIGPSAERWTPDTIAATGIGGSERMAWEMARRLVKLGNRVRVYGDCEQPGNFEGVEWFNHLDYHHLTCDVLIPSRRPIAIDDQFEVQAKARLCWVHDVHCGAELNQVRAHRIDRFLCLSDWHRQFFLQTYDFVHETQVIKTRNGIDLSLYDKPEERDPHRMFYSSSLDRGVFVAIEALPFIREKVPDASLHIYYGLDIWKRFASPEQKQQIEFLERLMAERASQGVHFHGRISPPELAKEQMRSGVWSYPTWWTETSCITGQEAQAAGCRVVTSPIAALNETVGLRGTMIDGYWLSPEYKAQFADACVAAMLKPGEEDREELKRYARENFSLDTLARDWVKMFHQVLREVEVMPVVGYRTNFARAA